MFIKEIYIKPSIVPVLVLTYQSHNVVRRRPQIASVKYFYSLPGLLSLALQMLLLLNNIF